uniref:Dicentracin-like n=1 Tax=Stegastes partitus TaxID=144197 RepID=A0A3B4Z7S9_9TELE
MKCISLFLVLSLVVLMAEPGDAFIHHIFKGIFKVGKAIYGAVRHGRWGEQQQQQQDQRDLQDLQDQQEQEEMEQRFYNRKRAAVN